MAAHVGFFAEPEDGDEEHPQGAEFAGGSLAANAGLERNERRVHEAKQASIRASSANWMSARRSVGRSTRPAKNAR